MYIYDVNTRFGLDTRCKWEKPEPPTAAQDVGRAAQPASARIARLGVALETNQCACMIKARQGWAWRGKQNIYRENTRTLHGCMRLVMALLRPHGLT